MATPCFESCMFGTSTVPSHWGVIATGFRSADGLRHKSQFLPHRLTCVGESLMKIFLFRILQI